MEFKKVVVPLVLAILLIGAVAAIVMAQNNDAPTEKDIVDARGRTVTIPAQVDKVVCLSAGSVRLVSYVAGVDKIVGVDSMDSGAKGSPANYFFATYRCAYDIKSLTDVGSEENQKAIIESGAQVAETWTAARFFQSIRSMPALFRSEAFAFSNWRSSRIFRNSA